MTNKLLIAALNIDELAHSLNNIATDDKREIASYTEAEILTEARYVLEMFLDGTNPHWNYEDLQGENGPVQQKWAQGEVRKLKALIAKFGKVAA
jgi:hypothetical protein